MLAVRPVTGNWTLHAALVGCLAAALGSLAAFVDCLADAVASLAAAAGRLAAAVGCIMAASICRQACSTQKHNNIQSILLTKFARVHARVHECISARA